MSERAPRPDWVRRLNVMADSVGGAEKLISLDVDGMVNQARETAGLSDFGDFDGDWRGRLIGLVDAIEAESNLSVLGRLMARQEILRCLGTRLAITCRLDECPAILDEVIEAPVIVTGQGRSGTSILLELLAQDPEARSIAAWEATNPVPGNEDVARLIARTEPEQEFWADIQPEYAAIHEHRSDLPVECITAMLPSFASFQWWMHDKVTRWTPDFVAALQYHTVFLKVLQYGKPRKTWVLKTPVYVPVLDLVFQFFPDAWILLTHRDPLQTLPSGMSTLSMVRWHRSDVVDLGALTEGASGFYDLLVAIKHRRETGDLPDRIIDVHFRDQMRNPVEGLRRVYAAMGRTFDETQAARIRRYLDEKPEGKFGRHGHRPDDWGLAKGEIREQTKAYVEAYAVELEE